MLQAVTVGDEVTELMARLEAEGEFAEQLFTHGLGVQTAEGMAEWVHWRGSARTSGSGPRSRAAATRGATPRSRTSPSTSRSTRCSASDKIGMTITDGYAPSPSSPRSRSSPTTPQAIYFGTTSGRLLPEGHRGRADDVIKGSPRDPSRFGLLDDADPELAGAA